MEVDIKLRIEVCRFQVIADFGYNVVCIVALLNLPCGRTRRDCSMNIVENVEPGATRCTSFRVMGRRKAEMTEMSFRLRPESMLHAFVGAVDVV